ncbi:MAG TPA: superoxide dismutase family protein [Caulobacteraceae bacterium]|nr:superoxide dismutase family protein [Caulobacteraceae bacterium]
MRLLPLLAAAAALTACATAPATALAPPPGSIAHLKGPNGEEIGQAMIQQVPTGVLIDVEVKGLSYGWHGMHIHENGVCEGPAFTSAGGHVHSSAGERVHGYMTLEGGEAGDLPNIWVGRDGTGKAQVFSDRLSLTEGQGRIALWGNHGQTAAFVIHAARDDHYTQPIGGSGARVACGTLTH